MNRKTKAFFIGLPILTTIGGITSAAVLGFLSETQPTKNNLNNHHGPSYFPGEGGNDQPPPNIDENQDHEIPNNDPWFITQDIFPALKQENFYEYIRIVNGKPIMGVDFISAVISYVLREIQISDGTIDWNYELSHDDTKLLITFIWNSNFQSRKFYKTYRFDVSNGV